MSGSVGMLGRLGISTSGAATTRLDYQSENLVMNEDFVNGNGLRGTLSHNIDRVRAGLQRIAGPIAMQPNAVELAAVLEWIMGGAPSGSGTVTYPLADSAVTKDVQIDRSGGSGLTNKVFSYATVGVDVATFRAGQGEAMALEMNCVAKSETVGSTYPSLNLDTANGPWILADLVLSVNATTVSAKDFELVVNNMIDKERFFNSNQLNSIQKLDREITFRTSLPFGDHQALYATGAGGVAVTATLTNGGAVLIFTLPKVAFPRKSPNTPGRVELLLPLEGRAYRSGATLELSTSLNPGP